MSRELHGIEKGIAIFEQDGDNSVFEMLNGSAAPGGDLGEQDAAPVPSLYTRTGTDEIYKKIASAGAAADWELLGNASIDQLSWRGEKVIAATDDTVAAGNVNPTSWTDNEQGLDHTAFAIGDFVLGDCDGTPALFEVTALPGAPNITVAAASQPIADNDTFMVQNFLPDSPASQEGQAIIHFPTAGSPCVKISDVNWDFATGINLSGRLRSSKRHVVTSADTVESAIEKLDGNQADLITLSGEAQGAVDHSTFTGVTILDNRNTHEALQDLETALEAVTGGAFTLIVDVPTPATPTVIDTLLVDNYQQVEYEIVAHDIANPGRVRFQKIIGFHNGHSGADATTVKDQVNDRQNIGNVNMQASMVLAGAAGAQTIGLEIETSEASGVRLSVRRTEVAAL